MALSLTAGVAFGQQQCGTFEQVDSVLKNKYGEAQRVMAMPQQGGVIFFYANAETGTWSLVVASPDGGACLIADGTGFEMFDGIRPPNT